MIALLKTRLCDAERIHSTCKAVFATLDHDDEDNSEDNSEDGESTDYDRYNVVIMLIHYTCKAVFDHDDETTVRMENQQIMIVTIIVI